MLPLPSFDRGAPVHTDARSSVASAVDALPPRRNTLRSPPGSIHNATQAVPRQSPAALSHAWSAHALLQADVAGHALQKLLTEALRQGAGLQPRARMQAALPWLLQPWSTAWRAAFPDTARPVGMYALQEMLCILFPRLDDTQRRALLPVIRRHAADCSLAQWVEALCLPRHGRHGRLQLRPLDAEGLAAHAAAALGSRPSPSAPPGTGLALLGASMAALGSLAILGTVSPAETPWSAVACSAGSTLAFAGPAALALRTAEAALLQDPAHPLNGVPCTLVRQVDGLLSVLLPAWSVRNRHALMALWCQAPAHRSLLDVARDAAELHVTTGRIALALDALSVRYAAEPRSASRQPALSEALAQMLLALAGTAIPRFPARHPLPEVRAPQALQPQARPSLAAAVALRNVADLHHRQNFQKLVVERWARQHPEQLANVPRPRAPLHRYPQPDSHEAVPRPSARRGPEDDVHREAAGAATSAAGNARVDATLLAPVATVLAHQAAQVMPAVVQPLLQAPVMVAGHAPRRRGMAPALYAGIAVTATSLVALLGSRWARSVSGSPPDESAAGRGDSVAERFAQIDLQSLQAEEATIVGLPDGTWTSAWDVQHARGDGVTAHRRLRRAPETPDAEATDSTVDSRHAIELALLKHFQLHHRAWLAGLTPAEQRLWLSQHLRLEQLEALQQQQYPTAAQELQAALNATGWIGPWDDVDIQVPGTLLDGQRIIDDRMPLLEYCLYRPHDDRILLFSRDGMPLTAEQDQSLRRVLEGPACRTLADRQLAEPPVDGVMQDIVKARFQRAALEAKARGALGSRDSPLRGAEIVLAFLAREPYVEVGELKFDGLRAPGLRLPAGTPREPFALPNYLVLRSSSEDPDEQRRGQVVLYRQEMGALSTFADEQAFSEFISPRRAGQETIIRSSLVRDAIAAAPSQARDTLRKLFNDERYPGRPPGWARQDHIELHFPSPPAMGDRFSQWTHDAARHRIAQAARHARAQHQVQRHRWSPLGMRAYQSARAVTEAQQDIASWQQHVHPKTVTLVNDIHRFLSADADAPALVSDTDRVMLSYQGTERDLDDWATGGWREHGPRQGARRRFPDAKMLQDLHVSVVSPDSEGAWVQDEQRSTLLNNAVYLSNLCYRLRDLDRSDRPLKDYQTYLQRLPHTAKGRRLRDAMADALRWRTRALIEASAEGQTAMGPAEKDALLSAWAQLDGADAPLSIVEIDGTPVDGLWALRAADRHYVLLFNGPAGDQLLDENAFKAFLADDRVAAEHFLQPRTAFRHHGAVAAALGKTRFAEGVPISYGAGLTPTAASRQWLRMLGDNAQFLATRTHLSTTDWMKLGAGLAVVAVCVAGTAGVAGALCVAGTAGWVVQGFRDGAEALERGDLQSALTEMLGAGASGFGMLAPVKVARVLFHGGRTAVRTAAEATETLLEVAGQAIAFDSTGLLITGLGAVSGLKPALLRRGLDGAQEVVQDGRSFVWTASGTLVETYIDAHGVRRLVDVRSPGVAGAPIMQREGAWRRRDDVPGQWATLTTPKPLSLPVAVAADEGFAALPAADRERLTAAFGLRNGRTRSSPDLQRCIDDATMQARIRQMTDMPEDMGLPSDMPALLRAWCDSRMGQHRGVRLFTPGAPGQADKIGDLFGYRIEGVSVPVPRGAKLPDLQALVAATGRGTVVMRLGLPPGVDDRALMSAVKRELADVMQRKAADIRVSWRNWQDRNTVLSPTSDNVHQHYPQLTKDEARRLTRQSPSMAAAGRTWQYGSDQERLTAGMLALRRQRRIREGLLQGEAANLDGLTELSAHLKAVLPSRQWSLGPPGALSLHFRPIHGQGAAGRMQVGSDGKLYRPGSETACAGWQTCIHAQLSAEEQAIIGSPEQLQRRVRERMEYTPLAAVCRVGPDTGRIRGRRAVDDAPSAAAASCPSSVVGVTPSTAQLDSSEAVAAAHSASTRVLWDDAVEGAHKLTTSDRKKLQQSNLASWQISDLEHEGTRLELGTFPASGKTLSGSFDRPGFWSGDLPGQKRILQPRSVLMPVAEGQAAPKVLEGIHPGSYALGADGILVDKGNLGATLTFSVEDLTLKAGAFKGRPITGLSNEELDKLQKVHVSGKFHELIKRKLLAENLRTLQAGVTYRMYDIRSCSEAKFLEGFIRSLADRIPAAASAYQPAGAGRPPLTSVTGQITLYTDKDPCSESCHRRLLDLRAWLPNVDLRVQSSFVDGSARDTVRMEWVTGRVRQMRGNSQHAGDTDAMLKDRATQEWYRDQQHQRQPRTWLGVPDQPL